MNVRKNMSFKILPGGIWNWRVGGEAGLGGRKGPGAPKCAPNAPRPRPGN